MILKKVLFLAFLLTISNLGRAQDKVYFDIEGNKVDDVRLAASYKITDTSFVNRDSSFKNTIYYMNGQKKSEYSFVKEYKKGRLISVNSIGDNIEWFENGNIKLKRYYKENQLHGIFITYWANGQLRRDDVFEQGKLIEGNCYDSLGNKLPEYFPYKTAPQFPGGEEKFNNYLASNLNYPAGALEKYIRGTVFVEFYVDADGKLSDIRILKSVHSLLDLEAVRFVSEMPRYIPGKIEGQNVRSKVILPINFKIN
jgi:TonB family protein